MVLSGASKSRVLLVLLYQNGISSCYLILMAGIFLLRSCSRGPIDVRSMASVGAKRRDVKPTAVAGDATRWPVIS
jgi:hypothetical protein